MAQNRHIVRVSTDLVKLVRDQDDRTLSGMRAHPQGSEYFVGLLRRQDRGRFVENQ
jgi:hypothetical protein